jgi:uncharacterized membrane protein YdjX (TVP38/TMEM64 family)
MTEAKALVLVFIGIGVAAIAFAAVMAATNASGVVFGLVGTVLVVLGAFVSSEVVVRYGAERERRKREEILLSR